MLLDTMFKIQKRVALYPLKIDTRIIVYSLHINVRSCRSLPDFKETIVWPPSSRPLHSRSVRVRSRV